MDRIIRKLGLKYGINYSYPNVMSLLYKLELKTFANKFKEYIRVYEEYEKILNLIRYDTTNVDLWDKRLRLERQLKDMVEDMLNEWCEEL